MSRKWIRGGVPRAIKLNGFPFVAADGEKITYMRSGRGGTVAVDGGGEGYQESNPFLGGFNQTLSVDETDFNRLVEMQGSGVVITGYVTLPSGDTYNVSGGISSDGPLENDNGTCAIEFRGQFEPQ